MKSLNSLFFFFNQATLNLVKVLVQLKKTNNRDWKKRTSTLAVVKQSLDLVLGLALAYHYSAHIICSAAFGGGKKSLLHCNSFYPHVPRELHLDFSASHQREVGDRDWEGDSVSADEGGYTEENAIHEAGALYCDCMMIHCPRCIKLISHSIVWALIYFALFEQDDEKSPPLDYGPRCKDTCIKAEGVGWWLPLFASLWIISCYHARKKSGFWSCTRTRCKQRTSRRD